MQVPESRRRAIVSLLAAVSAGSMLLTACSSGSSSGAKATSGAAATTSGAAATSGGAGGGGGSGTITVAVVQNPHMTNIAKLTPAGFTASHPNIKVKFVTLDENTLRDQVTKDVAAGGGQFDVVMIGPNDVPTWSKNKWIDDLTAKAAGDASYNVGDILKPIHDALSVDGKLYAVPFYGESSFLMYRKDLLQTAGLTMPANPTWDQVATIAKALKAKNPGMAGICLRGKTGWGENLAPLDTVVNTFGGQWFDTKWNAQLTSAPFTQAVNFYVNLIKDAGEPGAASYSFNECSNSMMQSKSAMWYDATVGASVIDDPKTSAIAGKLGYAPAPVVKTKASGWLWTWSLALESASKHKDAAWTFMDWATSKTYIDYAGAQLGWASVPPGSRTSTYTNPEYKKAAAAFADQTLSAITTVDPNNPGVSKNPYSGIQYVGIPEFADLGTKVSSEITAAIAGQESVADALKKSQGYAQTVGNSYK
ncbi:MAG: polyol transport system substrate-binding protein [Frankiales bacterium]|nr:polyol transport system substrate-binding protein [Frankiales bacterium]